MVIRVTPRAARDEVVGVREDGAIKIRLKAPPVEGRANQALINFLAKTLGASKSSIEIVSGASSREKRIRVASMPAAQARELLRKVMD